MLQQALTEAMNYARTFINQGKVASYIPELAKANPNHLGAAIVTVSGEVIAQGDCNAKFTMQSISKTISLILALQTVGYAKLFAKVGVEPTGDAFNSIVRLETQTIRPLNPMINAGAIATASCCMTLEDPFAEFLALASRLCGGAALALNEAVYRSEKSAGMKNRAMAYMMQSENILECEAEDALDLYFRMCSVDVTALDLAYYGAVLANNGVDPVSGQTLVESWIVRIVKTLMVTCGMYDGSGEFAMKVGIAAKSGVGGGIVGSVENWMGIAAFSPPLDEKGNSIGAYRIFEYLSQMLNLHYFSGINRPQE